MARQGSLTLVFACLIVTSGAAFLRSSGGSSLQENKSQGERPDDIADPSCKQGVVSPDLKVCCAKECGSCGTHPLCGNPGAYQEKTGKLVGQCCKDVIIKKKVSCDKDHPPCVLSPSYKEALNKYVEKRGKRSAIDDCNKAVDANRASADLGVEKGEFFTKLFLEGRTKYEDAIAMAIKVRGLCEAKSRQSKELVARYRKMISEASADDKKKDILSGKSKADQWDDKADNEKSEVEFYAMIIDNSKEVEKLGDAGIPKVKGLKAEVVPAKDVPEYHVKMNALIDDANLVYKDAEVLWQQWLDSSKDYPCSAPPQISHKKSQCKSGNTKFARRCPIVCTPGYDSPFSKNGLRCNRQGKFGKELYGEWFAMSSCVGRNCGKPPKISNGKTVMQDIRFPHSTTYYCNEGHSTDQDPNGPKSFSLRCDETGNFEQGHLGAQCLPVKCGMAKSLSNADVANKVYTYTQIATYTCAKGYTVDATPGGLNSFKASCQATGQFSASLNCKKVRCGTPTEFQDTQIQNPSKVPRRTYCGSENGNCKCKGTVYYGRKFYNGRPGRGWTRSFYALLRQSYKKKEDVDGTIKCSSGVFGGDPLRGYYKQCYCEEMVEEDRYFGDILDYKCDTGYTLDQSSKGTDHYTLACQADGEYQVPGLTSEPLPGCRPVSAGMAPTVTYGNFLPREMFYLDAVTVTADDGFSISGNPGDGVAFVLEATAQGTYSGEEKFQPVVCGSPPKVAKATTSFSNKRAVYEDELQYACAKGYSTDRTAEDSKTTFSVSCESDATFSKVPDLGSCVNVDDCADHTCGAHGVCVDNLQNYTCKCDSGYEMQKDNASELVCGNVDDCGPEACGVGDCIDGLKDYKCKCPTGFEQTDTQDGDKIDHTCSAVICGNPPSVDNANTSPLDVQDQKASFPDVINYQCEYGHTTDASPTGKNNWAIECKPNKKFTAAKECKRIICTGVADVANGNWKKTTAKFNESTRFDCDKGYTTDGTTSGDHGFTVTCQVNGEFGEAQECKPVTCGEPDEIPNGNRKGGSLVFKESVKYRCFDGFTTTGVKTDDEQFTLECQADGKFTKIKQCLAKICGEPPAEIDVMYSSTKDEGPISYPVDTEVICRDGYTVGGNASDPSTFTVSCEKTGDFHKYDERECMPVRCGNPPEMQNAELKKLKEGYWSGGHLNYEEKAVYECLPGYTTGGEYNAPMTYNVECLPSGDMSFPSLDQQCRNVNDCEQHTCGSKGLCIDKIGKAPAYDCKCDFGYEVSVASNGEKHCGNVDDCQGKDCGVGTCIDKIGDYSCSCPVGYYIGFVDGSKTCVAVRCSPDTPVLVNGRMLSTHSGAVDFPRTLRYKCDVGYSIDGSVSGSKRKFQSQCKADGQLFGMMSCQKITCGTAHVIPYTSLLEPSSPVSSVMWEDKAVYECSEGYTVGGKVDAKTVFEVTCKDNGVLTDPEVCEPVKCGKAPYVSKSRPGIAGAVYYGMNIIYRCDMGYTTDGSRGGPTEFGPRTCKKDGEFSSLAQVGNQCEPIHAGKAPVVQNARMTEYAGNAVQDQRSLPDVYYPKGLEYRCNRGYSTNGAPSGPRKLSVRVNSVGTFSPSIPSQCKLITYLIRGRVKAARSGRALDGVTVSVGSNRARSRWGTFTLRGMQKGSVRVTYSRSGYISVTKVIRVNGNVNVGGAGDINMAPKMRNDEWRAVLKWNSAPSDLDSYSMWGPGNKVCWYKRQSGGWWGRPKGILEVDKTGGFGPETLYWSNIGRCRGGRRLCDIKYYVNDYTRSGSMLSKGAQVTLYTGSRVAGTFDIKKCAKSVFGGRNWWHVFTLNARTNRLRWSCLQKGMIQTEEGEDVDTNSTWFKNLQASPMPMKKTLLGKSKENAVTYTRK